MRVAHLTFDLRTWRQGRDRVDDDHVDRAGADQHVGDLEPLLTGIGLGDEQLVDVHTYRLRVGRVHRVLGIDIGTDPAVALRFGHDMHGECRLAGRLGTEDLDDPPSWQASDAERYVERHRTGRDGLDADSGVLTHPHDRSLAELLLNLAEGHIQCLVTLHRRLLFTFCVSACSGVLPASAICLPGPYAGGVSLA